MLEGIFQSREKLIIKLALDRARSRRAYREIQKIELVSSLEPLSHNQWESQVVNLDYRCVIPGEYGEWSEMNKTGSL